MVVERVLQYYALLRSLLKTRPSLRECLTRCRHCRIFFLADRRNAGRRDLGCPFGCQHAHRRRASTQRSIAYYGDEEGKLKKKIQNDRRPRKGSGTQTPSSPSPPPWWPKPVVGYVRRLVSRIEGRPVSRREILDLLVRVLRQHSMARRRRIDQIIGWLHEQPP